MPGSGRLCKWKTEGETPCACLASLHANEKILGPRSIGVGVFLGRRVGHLAWYIMHSVCPNVVYEVFCVYLLLRDLALSIRL